MTKLFARKALGLILVVSLLLGAVPISRAVAQTAIVTSEAELEQAITEKQSEIIFGGDFSITSTKIITDDLTIDLNGHVLTFTYNTTDNFFAFHAQAGANLTINDSSSSQTGKIDVSSTLSTDEKPYGRVIGIREGGTLTINGGTLIGDYASIYIWGRYNAPGDRIHTKAVINGGVIGDEDTVYTIMVHGDMADLTVNNGVIKARGFPVSGNNNTDGTRITINGGELIGAGPVSSGLYLPQIGEVYIKGGTITAPTGIEVKSGLLHISGGTIHATGPFVDVPEEYGGGSVDTGDAVFVNSHSAYDGDLHVVITGGTLISDNNYGVREYNTKGDLKSAIIITGGQITGGAAPTSLINKVVNVTQMIGYTGINSAVAAAADDDVVRVSAGTYTDGVGGSVGGYSTWGYQVGGITLILADGVVIANPNTSCFSITKSHTHILAESIGGAKCVPHGYEIGSSSYSMGIVIDSFFLDLQDIVIDGLEIDGTNTNSGSGIYFNGFEAADVLIVNNYIHD